MNVQYDALALPCAFRFSMDHIPIHIFRLCCKRASTFCFNLCKFTIQKSHILSLIAMKILHLNMLEVSFINFCLISNLSNESFKISYENQNSFYLHI